jgi:hypothetical protein
MQSGRVLDNKRSLVPAGRVKTNKQTTTKGSPEFVLPFATIHATQIPATENPAVRQFFLTTWFAEICEADPRVYHNNHDVLMSMTRQPPSFLPSPLPYTYHNS